MPTTTGTWYDTADDWLTETESLNNAQLVANHFKGTDWSREAISALCGNMRHESSINPNIWEFGYGHSLDRGYGLVQWTPASKYIDWANAAGLEYTSGDSQLARIDYEVDNNIQWIPIADYNYMTFADFRANTGGWTVDYLTEAFTWSYERPARSAGTDSLPDRKAFANTCLNSLDWTGTGGGGTTPPPRPGYKVPALEISSNQYEKEGTLNNMTYVQVKAGDTLSAIAKKYGVNVNEIKKVSYSEIPNKNNISVGTVLILPGKQVSVKPVAPTAQYYFVKAGDNLTSIAKKQGTTISAIQKLNGIVNPNLIRVGQKLRVK